LESVRAEYAAWRPGCSFKQLYEVHVANFDGVVNSLRCAGVVVVMRTTPFALEKSMSSLSRLIKIAAMGVGAVALSGCVVLPLGGWGHGHRGPGGHGHRYGTQVPAPVGPAYTPRDGGGYRGR
jgi:hypothetical protein